MKKVIYVLLIAVLTTSCAVVRPEEAAMKQKFGDLQDKVVLKGPYGSTHSRLGL